MCDFSCIYMLQLNTYTSPTAVKILSSCTMMLTLFQPKCSTIPRKLWAMNSSVSSSMNKYLLAREWLCYCKIYTLYRYSYLNLCLLLKSGDEPTHDNCIQRATRVIDSRQWLITVSSRQWNVSSRQSVRLNPMLSAIMATELNYIIYL